MNIEKEGFLTDGYDGLIRDGTDLLDAFGEGIDGYGEG